MTRTIFTILTVALSSFAATYSLYSADGKFHGTMDAESLDEVHTSIRKGGSFLFKKFLNSTVKSRTPVISSDTIFLDTLSQEWVEIEKHEALLFCTAAPRNGRWILQGATGHVENDSCFQVDGSNLVGAYQIEFVEDSEEKFFAKVAVNMKVLDFQEGLYRTGYFGNDFYYNSDHVALTTDSLFNERFRVYLNPERLVTPGKVLLVDKYPVTNCDFIQTMWDSIPNRLIAERKQIQPFFQMWLDRKKSTVQNGHCDTHDSAATSLYLYHALSYANERSLAEGLEPVYSFKKAKRNSEYISDRYADGSFDVYSSSFFLKYRNEDNWVRVSVDTSANGYRLPTYDEWQILARGGDTLTNSSAFWKSDAAEYAWFGQEGNPYYISLRHSRPVGMLKPNGYGLYDILGLVCENTLLQDSRSFFKDKISICAGGLLYDVEPPNYGSRIVNGSGDTGFGGAQGLRLVRTLK